MYILLDSLLSKLVTNPEKKTASLAIPETCVDNIISLYHVSLFVGHQGIIKTYLTKGNKFFIPGFIHHVRSYVKGCCICQLSRSDKKNPVRQLQQRINLNYRTLSRLNMDPKPNAKVISMS